MPSHCEESYIKTTPPSLGLYNKRHVRKCESWSNLPSMFIVNVITINHMVCFLLLLWSHRGANFVGIENSHKYFKLV